MKNQNTFDTYIFYISQFLVVHHQLIVGLNTLIFSMDCHNESYIHNFDNRSFWWTHTTGTWVIFSTFAYITIAIWIWTFWITAIYSCHFHTSVPNGSGELDDAGHLPNILTAQYAEYILNFETLGSADFMPNKNILSDNALAFLHFDLFISLE